MQAHDKAVLFLPEVLGHIRDIIETERFQLPGEDKTAAAKKEHLYRTIKTASDWRENHEEVPAVRGWLPIKDSEGRHEKVKCTKMTQNVYRAAASRVKLQMLAEAKVKEEAYSGDKLQKLLADDK